MRCRRTCRGGRRGCLAPDSYRPGLIQHPLLRPGATPRSIRFPLCGPLLLRLRCAAQADGAHRLLGGGALRRRISAVTRPRPTPSARFALLNHRLMKGFFIQLLLPPATGDRLRRWGSLGRTATAARPPPGPAGLKSAFSCATPMAILTDSRILRSTLFTAKIVRQTRRTAASLEHGFSYSASPLEALGGRL